MTVLSINFSKSLLMFSIFLSYHLINAQSLSVYVSVNGSDSDGTGNITSPFQTIDKALDLISKTVPPFGTIFLINGTYDPQNIYTTNSQVKVNITSQSNDYATITELTSIVYHGTITLQNLNILNLTASIETDWVFDGCNITTFHFSNFMGKGVNLSLQRCLLEDTTLFLSELTLNATSNVTISQSQITRGDLQIGGSNLNVIDSKFQDVETISFARFAFINISNFHLVHSSEIQASSPRLYIRDSFFEMNNGSIAGALASKYFFAKPKDVWIIENTVFLNNTSNGSDSSLIAPAVLAIVESLIFRNCTFGCNFYNNSYSYPPVATNELYTLSDSHTDPNCPFNCKEGQVSDQGIIMCLNCYAGSFSNTTNSTSCTKCDAGTSTNGSTGMTQCWECQPGTQALQGQATCAPCVPGYIAPNSHSASCNPCPTGYYQPLPGQVNCSICELGSVAVRGSAQCMICGEGTYAASDNSTCFNCPIWYTSKPQSTSCPTPSLSMIGLICGLLAAVVIIVGYFIVRTKKRRAGYFAVRSLFSENPSKS